MRRMIPENIAIIFLILPLLCFFYIFRGLNNDENPLWGNILASGLATVISAMVSLWLIQGSIVNPIIISNTTYSGFGLSAAPSFVYSLGSGGSGMFIRAPISIETDTAVINNTNSISTYDIVYTQFQNFGLMILYMAFAAAGVILFLWFVAELRNEIRARDQDEYENPQEE